MSNWLARLQTLVERREPLVMVTVASVKGSAPREPGAKMLVSGERVFGTIGGGHLELKAIGIARQMLQQPLAQRLHRFPLGASLGQCCGGLVNLLIEPLDQPADWVARLQQLALQNTACILVAPAGGKGADDKLIVTETATFGTLGGDAGTERDAIDIARRQLISGGAAQLLALPVSGEQRAPLYLFEPVRPEVFSIVLFGAGHVGRALVNTLQDVECRITWVDSRADQFPPDLPDNVTPVISDIPEAEVDDAATGSYFLVMTHDHSLDQRLCRQILERADYRYFGLIGSRAKRRRFEQRLGLLGVSAAQLSTMRCPIGIAGITGKQPASIAIAVAAELIQQYEQARRHDTDPMFRDRRLTPPRREDDHPASSRH